MSEPQQAEPDAAESDRRESHVRPSRHFQHVYARPLARVFIAAGSWALLCIPGVLLSESRLIPVHQSFFHSTQCLAAVVALGAALGYLSLPRARIRRSARVSPPRRPRRAMSVPMDVTLENEPRSPRWRPTEGHDASYRLLARLVVILAGTFLALVIVVVVVGAIALGNFD